MASVPGTRGRTLAHEGFLRHRGFRWARIAGVLALAVTLVYLVDRPLPRPSGGSLFGYVTGIAGAALILWLAAIGVRKRWITRTRYSLKAWTSAHVYLGLALAVIGTLHTAFDLGWNVHTLAWALMMAVIVSGTVGVALYAALPRALSDNRGEMTEPDMVLTFVALNRQIAAAALGVSPDHAARVGAMLAETPFDAGGPTRLSGRFRHPARDALAAAMPAVPALAELITRRTVLVARIERHIHLKALLEVWLYVHVPLTFALLAALVAHVVAVFLYW